VLLWLLIEMGINSMPITATYRAFFICVYVRDAAHSHVEIIDIKLSRVPLQRQSNETSYFCFSIIANAFGNLKV